MRLLSALAASALAVGACSGASAPAARTATPASASAPAPPFSWAKTRHDARTAFEAKDYVAYRRQLEGLEARAGSPWVLVELARADVLLGDHARALAELAAFARTGFSYDLAGDAKLAPLRSDAAFAPLRARLGANEVPIAHARPALALPHDELVTEDIAYDAPTKTFFVSSIRHRKILAIGPDGRARDLVAESARTGSIAGLALGRHREPRLWATTAALPPMLGYDARGPKPTALLAFDPGDGALLQRIELPADPRPGDHALTDLAVAADGTVFVSDSPGGAVYALAPGASTLERLAGPDELVSPQTPAPSADGKRLFVPDYVRGIAAVDLATRALTWLGHADDVALVGIDGLYVDGSSFLAVQNGAAPPRVVRLVLGPDGSTVVRSDVLERATAGLGEPTHGVLVDGSFYFLANAGWNRFDDDGHPLPDAPADAPAVWVLPR